MNYLDEEGLELYDSLIKNYINTLITNVVDEEIAPAIEKISSATKFKGALNLTAGFRSVLSNLNVENEVGATYIFKVNGVGEATLSYINSKGVEVEESIETGDMVICTQKGLTKENAQWVVVQTNWSVSPDDPSWNWLSKIRVATIGGKEVTINTPGDPAENTVGQVTFAGVNVLQNGEAINGSPKKKLELPVISAETTGNNAGIITIYRNSEGTSITTPSISKSTLKTLLDVPIVANAAQQLTEQQKNQALSNLGILDAYSTYRGSFNLVSVLGLTINATHEQIKAALATTIHVADNNDFCFVIVPVANDKPTLTRNVDRWKYSVVNGTGSWDYEYTLDSSGFNEDQWKAINSTITVALVTKLNALPDNTSLTNALNGKVDKETGKGLSTNDYTTAEKTKLNGIAAGAEVNVQSDWNQTNTSADDYIKNKPTDLVHSHQVQSSGGNVGTTVGNVITLTMAQYNALTSYDNNTEYIIV